MKSENKALKIKIVYKIKNNLNSILFNNDVFLFANIYIKKDNEDKLTIKSETKILNIKLNGKTKIAYLFILIKLYFIYEF